MPYKKYEGEELKVGTKIRLAGREGEIVKRYRGGLHILFYGVLWSNNQKLNIDLPAFPDLEIAVPTPTISKEAREYIMQRIQEENPISGDEFRRSKSILIEESCVEDILSSIEENV